jgi:hypothetical protein
MTVRVEPERVELARKKKTQAPESLEHLWRHSFEAQQIHIHKLRAINRLAE